MDSPRGVVDRTAVKVAANTWWNYVVTSIWPLHLAIIYRAYYRVVMIGAAAK
jgi:hypothetical protein